MKAVCAADCYCRTSRELIRQRSKWRLLRAKPASLPERRSSFGAFGCRGFVSVMIESTAGYLDVEVSHIQRVVFDELAPRLDCVAQQDREDLIRFNCVVNSYL